jgi:hypothetical protein
MIVGGLAAAATAALAAPASAAESAGLTVTETADSAATKADKEAVLATLQACMDAITNRDKEAMRATFLADGTAVHSRNGVISIQRLGDLPDSMPGGTTVMEERLYDIELRMDHDVAMVWAPYGFYYDGVLDHVGTDIYSFIKQPDGQWLICGVTDNGRTVS